MDTDIAIIGAGIIGAACADALAAHGLRVTVIECDAVGSGATAAGMGHLVVMDDNPAELALTAYSLSLWRGLTGGNAARHEYSHCGTLWLAADDEEREAARTKQHTLLAQDIDSQLLDAHALYATEPHLRPGLAGALHVPGDGIVYPPKTARFLLERARGVRLVTARAEALLPEGVLLGDGSMIHARTVLVANGAAALSLCPELPIRPKKGHLVITDRYPGTLRHQLVELGYIKSAHAGDGDSVAFNVQPRPTGQLLIGSSRQFGVTGKEADMRIVSRMLAHAAGYMPMLAQLNALRCWTGFRAASSDGLPLIGPHPGRPNVWLATGHEGLGITTSLATAALLAAQFTGTPPAIPVAPYLPARFPELTHVHE
ncbi:NAD(P)/FAD-dependent oxidoreductase [Noviherbaspirillum denitrificans]|uniref:D-amino-acid oxidase n=1 Tax=Noviherbaspirillum denitrificans TaxID=1968433 RepID=A0A254TFJ7_9BURK|nr:FAD-dependent oxidoreductase [Noviherbaspirillum denitrificans]OWW21384.1 D-amino-acid oxidase [Noviherbaspirillum denitrificans]